MYETLLVPLDGSPFSAKALPVATDIARRVGATLHVVTVLDPSAYVPFVPGEVLVPVMDTDALEARRAADTVAIQTVASELSADGVSAVGTLLEGTVVEAIAEYAMHIQADLIIMTTHGRSGLERLWLGSVASAFLQRAPAPVFLVRPALAPNESVVLPRGKVLVPLDGTAFSDTILPHATRLAEALGSSIELFTVAVPHAIPMAPFGADSLMADASDLTRQEHEAQQRLKGLTDSLPAGTTSEVSTDMTAARAIIEHANQISAGAVAMATHGRTGLARFVLGSCSDTVVRGAHQAMLLYRPTEADLKS